MDPMEAFKPKHLSAEQVAQIGQSVLREMEAGVLALYLTAVANPHEAQHRAAYEQARKQYQGAVEAYERCLPSAAE